MVIRSRDNQLAKLIRSLRLHANREAERAFVVEGFRATSDAILAGGVARHIVVGEGISVPDWMPEPQLRMMDLSLINSIAETTHPQGIIAIFEEPRLPIPARPDPLFVILDGISDPGNLGAIIRTSAAAGVDAVFTGPGCVDWLNGKVVRSAMGAHFRIPVARWGENACETVLKRCSVIAAATGSAETHYDTVDWTSGAALIVGSEAHGISSKFVAFATELISIPMDAGVESLNASVAAGAILFEARRQRRSHASAAPHS